MSHAPVIDLEALRGILATVVAPWVAELELQLLQAQPGEVVLALRAIAARGDDGIRPYQLGGIADVNYHHIERCSAPCAGRIGGDVAELHQPGRRRHQAPFQRDEAVRCRAG